MTTRNNVINEVGELALSTRLQRLGEAIRKDATRIYREQGLDFEAKWFPVLYVLMKKAPIAVVELADELGYSHPSVIALIREMQKKGLVKSEQSETDGRSRLLSLTAKAKSMEPQFIGFWEDLLKVLKEIADNVHPLLKAVEETEQSLAKESLYDRFKRIKTNEDRESYSEKMAI